VLGTATWTTTMAMRTEASAVRGTACLLGASGIREVIIYE
jgi:hypothetical protein